MSKKTGFGPLYTQMSQQWTAFQKAFTFICMGFDGVVVAHLLPQWTLVHPIHCHQVASIHY